MFPRVIIFFSLLATFAPVRPSSWDWILPSGNTMTSTFGEFRVGHFHGGIDLRAAVGTPIIAPDDGWVQRISVSPWGYGKVLYFVFDDSLTAIFGHLSRFAKPLQEKVVDMQYSQKSPIVDMWFKRGEISFNAGDVIAYSGKTGVGKPHLHFEIRKNDNMLFCPQLLGFRPPDTLAPVVQTVALIPMSQNAWIEESLLPLLVHPDDDYSMLRRPVRFCGNIAVAISFYDHTDQENPNRNGVRKLTLSLDNSPIFQCVYDSFFYDETSNIGFLYDGGLEYRYGMRFHRLFVPGSLDVTPLAQNFGNDGIISAEDLQPGPHILRWQLEDFAQHTTAGSVAIVPSPIDEVGLQFIYDENGELLVEIIGDTNDIAIQFCPQDSSNFTTIAENRKRISASNMSGFFRPIGLQYRQIYPFILGTGDEAPYSSEQCSIFVMENFLYYLVKLNDVPKCVPEFAISGVSIEYQMLQPDRWLLRHSTAELANATSTFLQISLGDPEFPYAMLGEFSPVLCLMGSWTSSKSSTQMWNATLSVPDDAIIEPVVFYNWYEQVHGHNVASMLFHFLPDWQYFRRPAQISFKPTAQNSLPDDTLRKLCIVRWWNNDWYYIPTQHKGRKLWAKIRALGDFALMWDNEPPEAKVINTGPDTIVVEITDNLSGFGKNDLPIAIIDGEWTLSEYDPEDKTLNILPRKALDEGEHTLKLIAVDRAKNELVKEVKFLVE